VAGAIALFAPCCISVMLPAYFASSYQNRRRLVAMTFVFAAGIATVILPIALGASALLALINGGHTPLGPGREHVIRVTLLTRPDCAHCDDAKRILDELGREYPLRVTSLDVDSAAGQELALSGGLLFPSGILIEERPLCYGRPSRGKLRRELERLVRLR
jgi:thiol-disulfide isomerase/thioredoxin